MMDKGGGFFDVHSFIDKTHQLSTYYRLATVLGTLLPVLMGETIRQVRIVTCGEQNDEKRVGHRGTKEGPQE